MELNMKFGVMVCFHCHRALGANLQFKSVTCPYCHKKLKLKPAQIKFKCNSEIELTSIISKVNSELQDNSETKSTLDYPDFGEVIIDEKEIYNSKNSNKTKQKIYENLEPYKRIALKYKIKKESIEFITTLALDLGREMGKFSYEDFRKLIYECGFDEKKTDEYLEKLKNLNIIYEPELGYYKLIEQYIKKAER
jgi:hypothetical protein